MLGFNGEACAVIIFCAAMHHGFAAHEITAVKLQAGFSGEDLHLYTTLVAGDGGYGRADVMLVQHVVMVISAAIL